MLRCTSVPSLVASIDAAEISAHALRATWATAFNLPQHPGLPQPTYQEHKARASYVTLVLSGLVRRSILSVPVGGVIAARQRQAPFLKQFAGANLTTVARGVRAEAGMTDLEGVRTGAEHVFPRLNVHP